MYDGPLPLRQWAVGQKSGLSHLTTRANRQRAGD